MVDAFSLVLADDYSGSNMKVLADYRSVASIPFGGRYRLIDFSLSAICAADIRCVGVVARGNYTSLADHLKGGRDFDLSRKNGGLKMITPQILNTQSCAECEFTALQSADDYIRHMLPNYCIITHGNTIFNANLSEILQNHINGRADITVATKDDKQLLPIYILHKNKLLEILEKGVKLGVKSIKGDILLNNVLDFSINFSNIDGYCKVINSADDYISASFNLLDDNLYKNVLGKRILTKVHDSVPTIYRENAFIENSLFADGCEVNGEVNNSIIFRDVKIGQGAKVKNSILMQGCVVEPGAVIENCVADKKVRFESRSETTGKDFKIFKKRTMVEGLQKQKFSFNGGNNIENNVY